MSLTRHTRVKDLFAAACLEPLSERLAFVTRACGDDDDAMRREVESLLAFYEEPSPPPASLRAPRREREDNARFRRGRVLAGRYRIERFLGRGGMGEVYAVYDGVLRETVALKILPHADTEQRRRLVEEVRLSRQVTHAGVCRVYDIGEDAGMPFLTMELIEGEDLATRLARSGPLPSDEVAGIALHLAEALAAAHEAGVLHRDLKPSNILVGRSGGLYITDFGIATTEASRGTSTADGVRRFGTPAYMAPEECVPGGVATHQTDLYSLGLILYELLTGVAAFDAADFDTLLELQLSALPDPPSRSRRDVDPELEALVLALLAKDPTQRPESARAVVAALATAPESAEELAGAPTVERRQIVTLACRLEPNGLLAAPGRWPELVRMFQARCSAACRLKGGQVAQYLSSGLLVHFGLPRSGEQDATCAIEAALEIVGELGVRPLVESGAQGPRVTMMLDALPAVVRGGRVVLAPGSRERITAALPPSPEHEDVIVSDALLPSLRDGFTTTPFEGPDQRRWHRVTRARQRLVLEGGAGRLTPLAGRELELARLEQWWNDAAAGRGQVALISGEAGLGKSRLVHELWQRVSDRCVGFEVRCSSLHANTPLYPFVSMVAQVARLLPDDSVEDRTAKLRRFLTPLGSRADELLATFSAWLFTSSAGAPLGGGAAMPERDRRNAIAVIEECLDILAQTRPVLLLCEDLQWSDASTREAIERLVARASTMRLLLVVTFRPEFVPPWRGSAISHVALQPLRDDEARAMLSTLRARDTGDVDQLVERADGNPLYLEELAKYSNETSARKMGSVPLSLQGLLTARFDRLGAARRLAQTAAVCGRSVAYPLLRALAADGGGEADFDTALTRLLDAEILLQRGPLPRATLTFRHALLRDVAYDSIPVRSRKRLHGRLAPALLDLDPGYCSSNPELIARHWSEAGDRGHAYDWWKRAGLHALDRSAYSEAESHLWRALRALPRAVAATRRDREKLDLLLSFTALEMGRHGPGSEAAARWARRAQSLCAGLPIDDSVARALMHSARVTFSRGELRATLRLLEPLRAYDDRIEDPYLRAAVLTQAANLFSSLGRLHEADRFQDRAIEAYVSAREHPAGALTTDPLAHLQITRAANEWVRGRATHSRRWTDAALTHADRLAHPFSRAMVHLLAASLALRQGDQARFTPMLAEGARLARAVGSNWLINMANVFAPFADGLLTPLERAQRVQAALSVAPGTWLFRSVPRCALADALASAGHDDEALAAITQALRDARRCDPVMLPEIHRRHGELLARLGRRDEAEAAFRRGLRAARPAGAIGFELRCGLGLARLLAGSERTESAQRALASLLARLPEDVDAPERAEAAALLAWITP